MVNSRSALKTAQVLLDMAAVGASFYLAYLIRFEGFPPGVATRQFFTMLPIVVTLAIGLGIWIGVYDLVWRYASIRELLLLASPHIGTGLVALPGRIFLSPVHHPMVSLPYSIIIIHVLLSVSFCGGFRLARRLIYEKYERSRGSQYRLRKRALLIGAGNAGVLAAKEVVQREDTGLEVVGFIDDDPAKVKSVICGVRVLGSTEDLPRLAKSLNVEEAVITMAAVPAKEIRRIVKICESIPVRVKIVPGLYELLGGTVSVSKIREVRIEDLLGRDVVEFDGNEAEIEACFKGKRVMITGAGGSIGAELCRQIALIQPSQLIMLEKDENSLFEVEWQIRKLGTVPVTAVLADIRNSVRLRNLFDAHRPQVIFHAAAHKHVPLMELNPSEAILNNVVGTKHLVELAGLFDVETFVMLSTDKAVNPSSVMGASKRIAEMTIQTRAGRDRTRYACVRFGNVLASRGSVVPLFLKQISEGGPVTVTHPEATRYFMTIPEAAHLVIEAGSLGDMGEIFLLDMGEPVKILDLAKDLIHLSGLELGEDIEIEFIGLRPGEKLNEELLIKHEDQKPTKYRKIFVASPTQVDADYLEAGISLLQEAALEDDRARIYQILDEWFNGHMRRIGRSEAFQRSGSSGQIPSTLEHPSPVTQ